MCALASKLVKWHFNLLEMHELSAKYWIPSGPAPAVVQRSKDVCLGGLYPPLLAGKQIQSALYIPLYSLGNKLTIDR